ncbi:hypothetical protein GGF37_000225 [Kickxella alabastrina]|nr:hypothetical protein GGF37_000225 [Kickxella alabastrina]
MCPAPVNSYFDAQLLADFIMNGQYSGYDGTNTTATSNDPTYNIGNITAALSGISEDYESHDNARARKRRMTVSDDRRADDMHGFSMPESMGDALFSSVLDHHHSSYGGIMQQSQGAGPMLAMVMASGPEDPSLNAALTNNMSLGMSFAQGTYMGNGINDSHNTDLNTAHMQNPLGSPPHLAGRVNGRKHQSLSIAISQGLRNDLSSQEPPTPSMFSPSFANAIEGASAAGMSSPSMFYNVTSPYTPSHAHHHSFSMPNTSQQKPNTSVFDAGASVGSFGSDHIDQHNVNSPSVAAIAQSLNSAASFRHHGASSSNGPMNTDEDYSVGLQISMNAAVAAAMSGSFDQSAHNRSSSNASAFSRVQAASNVSQLLCGGVSIGQSSNGLDLDISTTLASFANIPGLVPFSSASMDRQNLFAHGLVGGDCNGSTYGIMSSEPSLFHSIDTSASLQNAINHNRFMSAASSSLINSGSPMASAMESIITSPAASSARSGVRSPVTGPKKSRKRAATISTVRPELSQQQQHEQRRDSHQIMSSTELASVNMQDNNGGMELLQQSVETAAYTGPVFNSQAVVKGTGSKVVMVMTSKVAQKSYGTEKRFLCPPPTILLFGDDWRMPTMGGTDQQASHSGDFTTNMPRISVSVPTNDDSGMGSEGLESLAGSSESRVSQLEWLAQPDPTPKPKAHVPHNPVPPIRPPREGDIVTGRYVAKQLYINDVDEKRKKVSVKVRLYDPSGQVVLNEFESRPIKVISKPSKKRQSVKNVDLCIHHGSTISLFNRLRSQTVSTKYLGATRSMSVGGPRPFWFPAAESDGSSTSAANGGRVSGGSSTTTFVARNSVWDPFIIWIVNTHLGTQEIEAFNERISKNPTPIPGYPTPPTFAMHPQCPPDFDHCLNGSAGGGCSSPGEQPHIDNESAGQPQPRAPIPILYNQPVILQCVSTGMCSPVLTLRKVEKGSTAVGSFYGCDSSRDVLGDPVSQLHKVAFEVRVQTREELPAVTVTPAGLNTRVGSYLTCMGDIVGLNATCDGRQVTSDGLANSKASGSRGSPSQGRKQAKESASVGTTSWAEDVGDNAVWTMVGTDCTIYRFDYPSASEIASQLQQLATNTLPTTLTNAESSSLALPPTPTSPSGMMDYSQHASHQHFSLEMMLADHGSTATAAAVAAAVNEMNANANFQPVSIDASLAAAVYGIAMPVMGDGRQLQQQQHNNLLSSSQTLSMGSINSIDEHINGHLSTDNLVPIVFKSAVQHPSTINPLSLDGGRRQRDGNDTHSVTERSFVTLSGLNFSPDMVVMFEGQQSLITEFKSSESIVCLGPLASEFGSLMRPDSAMDSDDMFTSVFGNLEQNNGDKKHQQLHPTSPSVSDSSTSHAHGGGEDLQHFALLNYNMSCANRASSAESTASSATATHNSPSAQRRAHDSAAVARSNSSAKSSISTVRIPILLSRNGGAGPTFKTGQFYTMHI